MYTLKLLYDLDFYTQLNRDDLIQAGDVFEWTKDAFTSVDAGSEFIGQRVGALPTMDGKYWSFRRVFRKVTP